jgi:hypothetical protein
VDGSPPFWMYLLERVVICRLFFEEKVEDLDGFCHVCDVKYNEKSVKNRLFVIGKLFDKSIEICYTNLLINRGIYE